MLIGALESSYLLLSYLLIALPSHIAIILTFTFHPPSIYQALHAHTVPESFETKVSWEEFCEFQATRASALRDLESLYADYIEDEREREGRLFRRWCR